MQFVLATEELEVGWFYQAAMRDGDFEQLAVELCGPEIEEGPQLRKFWMNIIILPDVSLQQRGMVWQAV